MHSNVPSQFHSMKYECAVLFGGRSFGSASIGIVISRSPEGPPPKPFRLCWRCSLGSNGAAQVHHFRQ